VWEPRDDGESTCCLCPAQSDRHYSKLQCSFTSSARNESALVWWDFASVQGFGRLKETKSETSWDLRPCLPEFCVSVFDAVQLAYIRACLSVCLSVQQRNTNLRHIIYCSELTRCLAKIRFELLPQTTKNTAVFRDVMLFDLEDIYRCFWKHSEDELCSTETLLYLRHLTRRHIQDYFKLQEYRSDNVRCSEGKDIFRWQRKAERQRKELYSFKDMLKVKVSLCMPWSPTVRGPA